MIDGAGRGRLGYGTLHRVIGVRWRTTLVLTVGAAMIALLAERLGGYPQALFLLVALVLGAAATATGSGVSGSRSAP